ncbi:2Fe-2S iron-sulfur cluster-binding protein [Paludibacterium yongneupense]|uniref:2Fe-2S iron-sulfur cluster-binding protein n=1 Tax=Paludibacterium yongneupense TaxID=400061 RepID=UPI000A01125D|nr:2Fe-2S iron-sulfur cluster-binding protein [Paludibacterium yongneupense]
MPILTFVKAGVSVEFTDAIDLIEIEDIIMFGCKSGNCGTCAIKVINGAENLTRKTAREDRLFELIKENDSSMRLACQCKAFGDVVLSEVN